jgi:hypothetical protein
MKYRIPENLKRYYRLLFSWYKVVIWLSNKNNKPAPHLLKQKTINKYRVKFDIETLIETGTHKRGYGFGTDEKFY